MKKVLILGAGQSTPSLISYMIDNAGKYDWYVTVADYNYEMAAERLEGRNSNCKAVKFDVNDSDLRNKLIEESDLVINLLPPTFQFMIALDCLNHGKHMITASYENFRVKQLHKDVLKSDILFLNEMGLDPGIDHMSAMSMIHGIRERGGYITSFISYGSGIPAPEVNSNPLKYCITWNARNVVMAGESGAQYMEDGNIKLVSHNQVFRRTWSVDVEGVGELEAYPNRDSLIYLDVFDLTRVSTMIRGTLRYPGWSETWYKIVKLGIPNETMRVPNLNQLTYEQFTNMFLPQSASGSKLETRLANYLNINPTGKIMQNFKFLGLLDKRKIEGNPKTAAQVLEGLLIQKMPLPKGMRDMVLLQHEIEAVFPKDGDKREKITSLMIEYGDPDGKTAIAKTVGLPAAIAAKLLLTDEFKIRGCQIPIKKEIYVPVLEELKKLGIYFKEKIEVI